MITSIALCPTLILSATSTNACIDLQMSCLCCLVWLAGCPGPEEQNTSVRPADSSGWIE
jgi:hypothetical protein